MSIYLALRLLAILTALLLASVQAAHGVEPDWINLGPGGGDVRQIAIAPSDCNIVYARLVGGVSRSPDRGATWAGESVRPAVSIAVDPFDPQTVYAGTASNYARSNGGVYKSEDGGRTWRQVNQGLADGSGFTPTVVAVAVDPHDSRTIYIASSFVGSLTTSVARSVDAGASWAGLSNGLDALVETGNGVHAIAIDPTDSATLYLAAGGAGLLASDDHGASWMQRNVGLENQIVTDVAIAGSDRRRLYVSTEPGVLFRSTDAAASWARVGGDLSGAPILSIAVAPRAPDTLYAALGDDGLFESRDGGDSWRRIEGLPRDTVQVVSIDASDGRIYVGLRLDGVLASDDGGRTWQAANLGLTQPITTSLALVPGNPGLLLAGAQQGVFASGDAGRSWTRAISPLYSSGYPAQISAVVAGTRPSLRLYAATIDGQVLTSGDGGDAWETIGPDVYNDGPVNLAVDPRDSRTLYAAFSSGVHKSTDAGASWERSSDGLPEVGAAAILVDPTRPQTVYIAMHGSGIYRSDDGGASWQVRSLGLDDDGGVASAESLAVDPRHPGVVYAGTYFAGVFRSQDFGDSWNSIGLAGDFGVPAVAVDPAASRRLYAATQRHGMWLSDDGGSTWQRFGTALDDDFVYALAVDGRSGRVYAAAERGVHAIPSRAEASNGSGGGGCAVGAPAASPAAALLMLSVLLAMKRGRPKDRPDGLASRVHSRQTAPGSTWPRPRSVP